MNHPLWLLLWIPLGAALGALVNLLADTLPDRRRIERPECPNCGARYPWIAALTRTRCPSCGAPRRLRHRLIPALFAVLFALFWLYPPVHIGFWIGCLVLVYFTLVAVIDLEHRLILHPVSLVGVLVGLATGLTKNSLPITLLGGAAGFAIMLLFYYLGGVFARFLARRRGQALEDEEALGFGDVFLTGIIGLMLGWPAVTAGLFLGILAGGLVGGGFLLYTLVTRRYRAFVFMPYGPFLILGALIILYPPW